MSVELDSEDPVVKFGEPLNHLMTPRGPFMVSRKLAIRDGPNIVNKSLVLLMKNTISHLYLPHRVSIQNVTVCTLKTSPCLHARRAHVKTHVRVVKGTFWTDTWGRGHGIFQRTTPHHTPHTQSNTIATTHGETCRDREREKEDRDKTTRDKRDDSFSVWCMGVLFVPLAGQQFLILYHAVRSCIFKIFRII